MFVITFADHICIEVIQIHYLLKFGNDSTRHMCDGSPGQEGIPKKRRMTQLFSFRATSWEYNKIESKWSSQSHHEAPSVLATTTVISCWFIKYMSPQVKYPKGVLVVKIGIFKYFFLIKQLYHSHHCFSSTFQISKCFWHNYFGKGQTRVPLRRELEAFWYTWSYIHTKFVIAVRRVTEKSTYRIRKLWIWGRESFLL